MGLLDAFKQYVRYAMPGGLLNAEWTPQNVRNAGHDAVLGYSKVKNGPFLSELFDVREMNYPDKFGGYKVWPSLLSK